LSHLAKLLSLEVTIKTSHKDNLAVMISCLSAKGHQVWEELRLVDGNHLHTKLNLHLTSDWNSNWQGIAPLPPQSTNPASLAEVPIATWDNPERCHDKVAGLH
jgi:hypothetical protein